MNRWYATSQPQHMLPAVAACASGTTRWYATSQPQHMLPAVAACASGTTRRFENQDSKPAPGRRL